MGFKMFDATIKKGSSGWALPNSPPFSRKSAYCGTDMLVRDAQTKINSSNEENRLKTREGG